jgi:hypothetical protein
MGGLLGVVAEQAAERCHSDYINAAEKHRRL